ncbi:MAG: 50S ribosomal protein L32 [Mariprofundales bacterium]
MATPKRKTSTSKRNMRRSHDAIKTYKVQECPECGEPVRPHHACAGCGMYRNRQVLKVDDEE